MVRVPTLAEEDAKRPNRERQCLVGERTRIVNRIKATLARLGIRNFKPTLRKAAERLAALSTPEGSPLPPNVSAELERDIARLGLVSGQIKQIEQARRQRLAGCGKSRDFGETVMKRARNGNPGLIKSTGYEGAKGDESGWKHHRPTFSAAC